MLAQWVINLAALAKCPPARIEATEALPETLFGLAGASPPKVKAEALLQVADDGRGPGVLSDCKITYHLGQPTAFGCLRRPYGDALQPSVEILGAQQSSSSPSVAAMRSM